MYLFTIRKLGYLIWNYSRQLPIFKYIEIYYLSFRVSSVYRFSIRNSIRYNCNKFVLPFSSSLNPLRSPMMSSGGAVNPVKEKEKPRLALDARLSAAPLLTSSRSSFSCALLAFRMWWPPPFLPGDAPITLFPKLAFPDRLEPPLSSPLTDKGVVVARASADVVRLSDCLAAACAISSWSDLALTIADAGESILSCYCRLVLGPVWVIRAYKW